MMRLLFVLLVSHVTLTLVFGQESSKPGMCPAAENVSDKTCESTCSSDMDCDEKQKCCSNGCSYKCQQPLEVKPGQCPLVGGEIGSCSIMCSGDDQCYGNKKCCHNGCGTECMELPMQDAEGQCSFLRVMLESAVAAKESSAGELKLYIPNCDANGDFKKLQCNDKAGMLGNDEDIGICWCANKQGTRIEQSLGVVVDGENPDCDHVDLKDPESCDSLSCNLADCKFGYKANMHGCPVCACYEPCSEIRCPDGTECHPMHVLCSSGQCSGLPQCVPKPPPCNNGEEAVSCLIDPCQQSTCPANSHAYCRVDNCGSCKAVFYDSDHDIVDCMAHGERTCPDLNPSIITTCEDKCGNGCPADKMCCAVGCTRDCITPVIEGLSKCQQAAKRASSPAVFNSSDGTVTPVERMIPRCTVDGRFERIQCADSIGICWCVDEQTGTEVHHTAVRGIPDCESGALQDPAEICPNGEQVEVCAENICYQAVCLADPSAVCRVNPCGGCIVEFFDHSNQKVDCFRGLTPCQKERQIALNSNNRGYATPYLESIVKNLPQRAKDLINKLGGVCGIPSTTSELPKFEGFKDGLPSIDSIFQVLFEEGKDLPSLGQLTDLIEALGGNLGDTAGFDVEDVFDGLKNLQDIIGDLIGSIFDIGSRRKKRDGDAATDLPPLFGSFVPRCTDDGDYAWKQCHGNTGVCWCANITGTPILSTLSTRPASTALKCDKNGKVVSADGDDGGQTSNTLCPNGNELELCLDVSCSRTSCHGNPDAFCVIDPCNNCTETWKSCYNLDGNIKCNQDPAQLCPNDKPAQICTQDLCAIQTCKWNRCATCKVDICGECKARFYDKRGKEVDCHKPVSRCQLNTLCLPDGMLGAFVPQCTEDGKYSPVQCHGSTGFCWCVDASGTKIEGTETRTQTRDEMECSEVPIQSVEIKFAIKDDFSLVKNDLEEFKKILTNHLVDEFSLTDPRMIQNLEVTEGSILVSYDLVQIDESVMSVSDISQHMESEFKSGYFKVHYKHHVFTIDESTAEFSMQTAEGSSSGGSGGTSGIVVAVVVILLITIVVAVVVGYVVYRKRCMMGSSTAKYMRSKDGPEVSFEQDTYSLPTPNHA